MSRILIIEDEEAIAELEKDYLELSGFEVVISNRGDLGLEKALNEDFDLIILDLMLPEVDGFEICRQVREAKNTPIIMVSAKKDDIDKIRGLGLGADDYMTKPFSPSELVARVKAHMDRYNRLIGSTVQKNDTIEIRGIKIDKTARRVWVNGEETTFTTISLHSWRRIQTGYLPRKSFSVKSGIWSLWETLPPLPSISRKSVRKSNITMRSRSTLKQYGELDTDLKCKVLKLQADREVKWKDCIKNWRTTATQIFIRFTCLDIREIRHAWRGIFPLRGILQR